MVLQMSDREEDNKGSRAYDKKEDATIVLERHCARRGTNIFKIRLWPHPRLQLRSHGCRDPLHNVRKKF